MMQRRGHRVGHRHSDPRLIPMHTMASGQAHLPGVYEPLRYANKFSVVI